MGRKVTGITDTLTMFERLKEIVRADDGAKLLEDFCEAWRKNHDAKRQRKRLKNPSARERQIERSKAWYAQNKDAFNKKRRKERGGI